MVNKEYYKLGQKIRNFRKRAGKSQMELELEIGASAGSISRIENGEVNPTKETLIRIIDALNLSSFESVLLFGFDISDITKLLKTSVKISTSKNLDEILQSAVNDIVFELNLLGGFITLKEGDRLFAKYTTRTWYTDASLKVIGKDFNTLSVSLLEDKENLMVKAFHDKQVYYSHNLNDFVVPAVPKSISEVLKRISGVRAGIALPIILDDNAIGTVYFGKSYADSMNNELPILKAFTEYIAESIKKIKK